MSIVESIRNPVYVSEDGSRIDCLVKFDSFPNELPFTADANDCDDSSASKAIHASLLAGVAGPIAPYVPPPPKPPVVKAPPESVIPAPGA